MINEYAALTNIALDIFSVAVTVIMLACFRNAESHQRQSELFLGMMVANAIGLVADLLSWVADGRDSYAFAFGINVVAYIVGYVMGAYYVMYVVEFAEVSPRKKHRLNLLAVWLCLFASAAAVVGMATGTYLRFVRNYMVPGKLYWVGQVLTECFLLLAVIIVFAKRKALPKRQSMILILYAFVPLVAALAQVFYSEVVLIYAATTVSLLAVYATVFVQQRDELLEREAELTEAKLNMAISQIQPHFLYNSLNTITQMCAVAGATEAEQATVEFARYLRGNLESLSHREPVPFAQELSHTQTYAKLEKLRYGDELELAYEIETVAFKIPALTLQPLVENAIKHGLGVKAGGGKVTVRSFETEEGYRVTVTDNGVGFDTEHPPKPKGRTSIGIENVRTRMNYRVNGNLTVKSTPGEGTEVTLYIPK